MILLPLSVEKNQQKKINYMAYEHSKCKSSWKFMVKFTVHDTNETVSFLYNALMLLEDKYSFDE